MRRVTLRSVVYPALLVGPCAATLAAWGRGHDLEGVVAVVTLATLVAIALAERALPYEPVWNRNDGQGWNDAALALCGVVVSGGVRAGLRLSLAGVAVAVAATGPTPWPSRWPPAGQLAVAVLVAELGLWAAHRALHEVPRLWRVHALHHSATRLYHLNNFRIHPIEVALLTVCGTAPLVLLGAPPDVIVLATALSLYPSLLAHANVDVPIPAPLHRIFNTPDLHRWHHSIVAEEANANYGEGFVIFDVLLGTHRLPRDRRVGPLGVAEPHPVGLVRQLAAPLRPRALADAS
jgi:sterol desaturase/sphingolipid hydroxylase (fatty acid hydroxylase superfamily)